MKREPVSIGVTGHRDIATGDPSRAVERELREVVRRHARTSSPSFRGVSCLAAGADQLFARATLDLGGALVAIVPCLRYEDTFNALSLAHYHRLRGAATEIIELGFEVADEAAFAAASQRLLDECEVVLAVWDGAPAAGYGGTADVVDWARQRGREVEIIWPSEARRATRPNSEEEASG